MEQNREHKNKPQKNRTGWQIVVDKASYLGMVKNMPYLMFLALLCVGYIANNNKAVSLIRTLNNKTHELKEMKWKYMDLQSRLMYQTSESQLILKTEAIGLKPLEKPAFEIRVQQEKKSK